MTEPITVRVEERKTLTPENLTWEDVKNWSASEMKMHMGSILNPGPLREAVARVAQAHNDEIIAKNAELEQQRQLEKLPPGQRRQIEEQQAATAQAEQERVAAEQAEQQRLAAEAEAQRKAAETVVPPVVPAQPETPKKIVLDYQIRDEKGNPIGRPTHLEAATNEEMIEKMKEAHTQATRAFHRLKDQKVQSLREVANQTEIPVNKGMSDQEMLQAIKDLKSDDPQKALAAHKALNKAEMDRIQVEADQKVAAANEHYRQQEVSKQFLSSHQHDFNNCQANVDMISAYFQENKLPWTLDNLEVAFLDLSSKLAPPVERTTVQTPPANPAPASATTQPTPTVVAAAQPTPTVTAPATPPANPVPAQPRPGVNGGIVPGQNSGPRPPAQPKGITRAEILSWDGKTMREKMRNPQTRAEIEKVLAASRAK